mgnify:FL=1
MLKKEMIGTPPDLRFTNAGKSSMSGTSDTTAKAKSQTDSQLTPNSPPNAEFRLIHALAGKLGKKVEWKKIVLTDGRSGWMLFFDSANWQVTVNGNTNELTPR